MVSLGSLVRMDLLAFTSVAVLVAGAGRVPGWVVATAVLGGGPAPALHDACRSFGRKGSTVWGDGDCRLMYAIKDAVRQFRPDLTMISTSPQEHLNLAAPERRTPVSIQVTPDSTLTRT